MYPWQYNPMMGMPPPVNDSKDAMKLYKMMRKLEKKATDTESAKHKDKVSKPKSKWDRIDIAHIMIGAMFLSPFVGMTMLLIYINLGKSFARALLPLVSTP